MRTDEEEELLRQLEREGFPMGDTMVAERPEVFTSEDDIDATPGVCTTPPHPRRNAAGLVILRDPVELRRYVESRGGALPGTVSALQPM